MVADASESTNITVFPLVSGQDSDVDALTAIVRRLASAHSLAEVMEIVTHAARVMLAADGITFVLRDGERCYYAEEDAIGPLWKGRRFPMSACISGWCMEHGRTVAIPDIYEDERIPKDAYRPTFVRSLAMVPVRQEEPIAALGAYWARPHQPSTSELELLQTIANAAALSIAYVQLRATQVGKWRRLTGRLTGLRKRSSGQLDVWSPSPAFAWSQRLWQIAIGLAFAVGAFLVRLPLGAFVGNEVPYATFFAAIVISTMLAGPIGGVTALLAGGVAAHVSFVEPVGTLNLSGHLLGSFLLYTLVSAALITLTHKLVATSQREKDLNDKLELVRGELQHRIKNFITVVQALAIQTGRSSTDVTDFDAKFTKRLHALAGAQELIDDPKHSSAGVARLIERTLAPFGIENRLQVTAKSDLRVSEDVAVGLALILNELATNALKYGALSGAQGIVSIETERSGDRARIIWREQGGPKVEEPSRSGFGTRLIRSALPKGRGTAAIDYRPRGVRCRLDFACVQD